VGVPARGRAGRPGADHPAGHDPADHGGSDHHDPPTTTAPPPTTTPPGATARVELRPDGLGVAGFGAGEAEVLDRLERRLGAPQERGAWNNGATPFGTCPGPVRAVCWGRPYVLFTSGPTAMGPVGAGTFTYQVDAAQRTKLDPNYTGPPPPQPPPLRGYNPRTAPGSGSAPLWPSSAAPIPGGSRSPRANREWSTGSGSAWALLGELSGSLSGGTPGATVITLVAGAACGE
jgi:hypothetical protein